MKALKIHREIGAECVTLRLEGSLDGHTAGLLQQAIEQVGHHEVVLDFSHLREFKDTAVAVLTRLLVERGVRLKGLALHHERVFGYFGLRSMGQRLAFTANEDAALA